MADVQYGDFEAGSSRYYRKSLAKLQECVDFFNSNNPLFVIQLGDFIESDAASYGPVLSIYNQLSMDHYHVLGNHDYEVRDTPRDKVGSILGMKDAYYDFAYKGWRFVVLNSSDISKYGTEPGSRDNKLAHQMLTKLKKSGAINAKSWNGGLGPEQKAWLAETLAAACLLQEKVIIFCHHPVYPSNIHNLWNDQEIISIIESYDCVVGYINGHNHGGNYGTKNGVHYLTLHGMVETKEINAYAMIEVYAEHLKVVGYGREPYRILGFNHSSIPE
jgi:3',5'-cyclic AMP phosphodiesterase CpdA